uniref:Retrovirus-related Pol polyprotein from transposon TNT 1-94 n=1 Tax=Tanacetum cinerariifolium TaxID=118510 RepID=A0A6L2KDU0_TANCI|nr:hypothetical protein [Tanacetum cinerariifolium]
MESCDPVGTSMEIKDKLDLDQNGTPVDATKYRSMIGALMYLKSSRPDIVHATCLCARYPAKPTEKHLKEVKRIFRYLWGTINTGLWYMKVFGFELTGFLDADYAGCKDTFKSTSEYVSLSACCAQVLWMRTQLTDYGFYFNKIPIYCDSKSAIAISCNPVQHSRTKHIAVRYHFIKEHAKKGTIELYFVKTDYQLAYLFTKALPVDRFNYLVRRLASLFHLAEEDFKLENLKFVPKGEIDEVFGMLIPDKLISNNIRNAPYYNAYQEMVAKHDLKMSAEKEGKKKTKCQAAQVKACCQKGKQTSTSHSKPEPKLVHQGKGDEDDMELAIKMSLETFQAQSQAYIGGVAIRKPVAEATRPLPVVEGKGKAIVTKEQASQSLLALHNPKRRSARSDMTSSGGDTEVLQIIKELVDDVGKQENIKEKTVELDQGQVGPDPCRTLKSRPPPKQEVMDEDQAGPDLGESRRALAGPDPEPTHEEFMADLYPKVHESLKFLADEHVFVKDPINSTETLSLMKNLEDAFAIGDQFINNKSIEDEPVEPNVEAKVVSMITVLIYQASSSVPPLSIHSLLDLV